MRSSSGVSDQRSKAWRAAAQAASTSAGPASRPDHTSSPVAGQRDCSCGPLPAAGSPCIQWLNIDLVSCVEGDDAHRVAVADCECLQLLGTELEAAVVRPARARDDAEVAARGVADEHRDAGGV